VRERHVHPGQSTYESGSVIRERSGGCDLWHQHCSNARGKGRGVRVRIIAKPREHDIEGVSLDTLRLGTVCDVSASIGSWLIVQGYAYPEMRKLPEEEEEPSVVLPPSEHPERRRK
jgi:hypothetical protein